MIDAPDLTRRPRTRRVFSADDMKCMAALYYDPAVPMHRVGEAFGVPASTFLRWIAEMDWPRRSARGRAGASSGASSGPEAARAGVHAGALSGTHAATPTGALSGPPSMAPPPRRAPPREPMPKRLEKIEGEEPPDTLVAFMQGCVVARQELDVITANPPETLHERERVARVIASVSATLLRFQRGYEIELARFVGKIAKKRYGIQ